MLPRRVTARPRRAKVTHESHDREVASSRLSRATESSCCQSLPSLARRSRDPHEESSDSREIIWNHLCSPSAAFRLSGGATVHTIAFSNDRDSHLCERGVASRRRRHRRRRHRVPRARPARLLGPAVAAAAVGSHRSHARRDAPSPFRRPGQRRGRGRGRWHDADAGAGTRAAMKESWARLAVVHTPGTRGTCSPGASPARRRDAPEWMSAHKNVFLFFFIAHASRRSRHADDCGYLL